MKRSKHTLSNYKLLSCDMGKLVPVGLQEALPGDTWQLSTSALIRVSPLAAPVMHPVKVRIHHFFVPHRLYWPGWEDFITGGPDGNDASTPPTRTGVTAGQVYDYLGVPALDSSQAVSLLPLYAYNGIYNEYYRDQDLQTEAPISDQTLRNVAWEKDYFTAARPFTQKGDDVTLPLGTQAPIKGLGVVNSGGVWSDVDLNINETGATSSRVYDRSSGSITAEAAGAGSLFPDIYADLSAAGAIDVNDFRRAFALQRYKEARARYGSRYTEYLRYLGVTPSDARLQRPEYLGGGTSMVNFSEVLNTAATSGGTGFGIGDMYGHGVSAMRTNKVRRFIEEHGYIMTLMSVRPKTVYQQGIPKTFLKTSKEDYYQKELEYIGQQPITKSEVFMDGTNGTDTWGYVDRYREYRETPSTVAGDFRSDASPSLDYWHMARDFSTAPALNEDFIKCVPTKRVHNVQTNDVLWAMINNHAVARRIVSKSAYARIL